MDIAALQARLRELPATARFGTVAGLCVCVVLSILFAFVARPQRSALFATPLYPEQLAEVQERLASWNVAFTPAADNVLVEARRRSDLQKRASVALKPQ